MKPSSGRFASAAANGGVVWTVVLLLVVVAVAFAHGFATPANLNSVSRQGAVLAVVALAQFLVVLTGHVDLSIASNAKVAALAAAITMDGSDRNLALGVTVAVLVGVVVGALNALIVVYLKVESFIATLGTAAIAEGVALFIAPTPVGKSSPGLVAFYGQQLVGGIYAIVLLVAVIWLGAWIFLRRTVWGSRLFAAGGDSGVAQLSGIRVRSIQTGTFLGSGVLAGVAGLLILGSSGIGDPTAADGLQFTTLAVVVIGGASLEGGRGKLFGLLGGVVLFAILGNIFNLLHIEVWYQQLFRGLIVLVAAALFVSRSRRRRRARHPVPGPRGGDLTSASTGSSG